MTKLSFVLFPPSLFIYPLRYIVIFFDEAVMLHRAAELIQSYDVVNDLGMRMQGNTHISATCYTTMIARPDNFGDILWAQRRRNNEGVLDGLQLCSQKNEWIEASFAAAQLARVACCPQKRVLVLLPGKNYQLEEDAELFEATLVNGCQVLSSDVRCYYFLREEIDWSRANFKPRQLDDAAKLPAPITPAYLHNNGDVTLTSPYRGGMSDTLCFGTHQFSLENDGQARSEGTWLRVSGKGCKAHVLLGHPQPGDALAIISHMA